MTLQTIKILSNTSPTSRDSSVKSPSHKHLEGGDFIVHEIWKDVVGYEGIYEVSSLGMIRSLDRLSSERNINIKGKILKLFLNSDGYLWIRPFGKGKKIGERVHRIVAQAFIPNPENKCCVNHKNGIKTDNRVENLEWNTIKENIQHAFETNLISHKGSKNSKVKLTIKDINEIFDLKKQKVTHKKIAEKFNVSHKNIEQIVYRTTWKHLKQDAEGLFYE